MLSNFYRHVFCMVYFGYKFFASGIFVQYLHWNLEILLQIFSVVILCHPDRFAVGKKEGLKYCRFLVLWDNFVLYVYEACAMAP